MPASPQLEVIRTCTLKRLDLQHLYVPATTMILVIALGVWLGHHAAAFNPDTAAQNSRMSFQSQTETLTNNLSMEELRLAKAVGSPPVTNGGVNVLYQGNSQTIGIFDQRVGDLTSAQWLQVLASRDKELKQPVTVRVSSLPGATLTDLLVMAVNRYRSGAPVNMIVLSLLPDEFRKSGLRDEVKDSLADGTAAEINTFSRENLDLGDAAATLVPMMAATSASGGADQTKPIGRVEAALEQAASCWPLFRYRQHLRGEVAVELLRLRNAALHLRADKQRPVPPEAFNTSSQVLELLVRLARAHETAVVIYLGPVLPAIPGYYSPEDMTSMQQNVSRICEKYRLQCFDYRTLVPLPLWGPDRTDRSAPGEAVDFVHLSGPAHQLLATQLFKDIHAYIETTGPGEHRR